MSLFPLIKQVKSVTSHWSRLTLGTATHLKYVHLITVNLSPIIHGFADWPLYPECEDTKLIGHKGLIFCAVISSDGRSLFTGSYDKTIIHWNMLTNEMVHQWTAHRNWVRDLDHHHSGLLVSVSDDGAAKVWDATSHELVIHLTGDSSEMRCVRFSKDALRVISGGKGCIILWSIQSGECLRRLNRRMTVANALIPLGEGPILSGWMDSTLRIWKGGDESEVRSVDNAVLDLSLNCDGSLLACIFRISVKIYQWPSMKQVRRINSYPVSGCFHPSNPSILALGTKNGPVEVYDVQIGVCLKQFKGHYHRTEDVCFTPDGTRLVSVSGDQTVRVWDSSFCSH